MIEGVLNLDPKKIPKEYEEAKRRMDEGGDDPKRAAELALYLFQEKPKHLNGRLISAIWNKYKNPPEHPDQVGFWTIRRVDEVVVKNLKL